MNSKPYPQLIAEWARRLERRGLTGAAQAILPILKPIGGVASPLLWMGQPLLSGWVDRVLLGELALLLEDPTALEELENYMAQER